MKRSSFDETKDQSGDVSVEKYWPCTECKKSTLVKTLTQYGARCNACYEFYLTCAPKSDTANKRTDGPKGWAQHLKARELAGARLTPTQREMWRAALNRSADVEQETA